MSDPRRILDRQSEASALARDLVGSARDDQPAAGAKARARAQLEGTLGREGITTHISSLSAAMAELKLSAPVLAPTPLAPVAASERVTATASRAWLLYASIAAAGIIAVGGVGIALVLRGSSQPNVAQVQMAPPPATPNTTAAAAPGPTPAPTPTPAAPAGGTTVAANTETPGAAAAGGGGGGGAAEPGHERSGGAASGGGSRGARERSTGSAGGGSTASAGGGGGAGSTASGGGHSCAQRCHGDIDCLLRCGTASPAAGGGSYPSGGGGGGGGGSHPSGGGGGRTGGGPETPSRGDVMGAMGAVRGAVQGCGQGRTGTAAVSITFASSGRVTTASVAPPFVGTPTGSCIARAVRGASVPPFTRPTFTVNYPFIIH